MEEKYSIQWHLVDSKDIPLQLLQVRLFIQTYITQDPEQFFCGDNREYLEYPHCFQSALQQADKHFSLESLWNSHSRTTQTDLCLEDMHCLDTVQAKIENVMENALTKQTKAFETTRQMRKQKSAPLSQRNTLWKLFGWIFYIYVVLQESDVQESPAYAHEMCFVNETYYEDKWSSLQRNYCSTAANSKIINTTSSSTSPSPDVEVVVDHVQYMCPVLLYYQSYLESCSIAEIQSIKMDSSSWIYTFPTVIATSILQLTFSLYLVTR
jgi:hypothetical protein